jgi:hypothetical protein
MENDSSRGHTNAKQNLGLFEKCSNGNNTKVCIASRTEIEKKRFLHTLKEFTR